MKLALIALLAHPLFILGGTALFAVTAWGLDTLHNPGSHGLSEIVYEFSSAAANNGSGFEGLGDNTVPWNIATGVDHVAGSVHSHHRAAGHCRLVGRQAGHAGDRPARSAPTRCCSASSCWERS